MTETVEKTATGAIVYDKAIINQISDARFTSEGWPHAELLTGSLRSGGRGRTMFVGNVPRQFVLRHYVRGGLIGRPQHLPARLVVALLRGRRAADRGMG